MGSVLQVEWSFLKMRFPAVADSNLFSVTANFAAVAEIAML